MQWKENSTDNQNEEEENVLSYTYKIYKSEYNAQTSNKQCNAGRFLKPEGPPVVLMYKIKDVHVKL